MALTYIILGQVGALLLIAAFLLGEWHGRKERHAVCNSMDGIPTREDLEERERIKQVQAAFRDLQNYNVAQAYGMDTGVTE